MPNAPKIAKDKSPLVADLPTACASEDAAVAFIEQQRWGGAPVCPHCGVVDEAKQIMAKDGTRGARYLWRCTACKKQFTVRVGTIFGDSKIPLRHWCYAFWAACASKKGVSALQIKRQTGLSYKSALFLMHRIRLAMTTDSDAPKLTGTVEADETYVGGSPRQRSRADRRVAIAELDASGAVRLPRRSGKKVPVVAVVQRSGEVRASVMPTVTAKNVREMLLANVDRSAVLMTDESLLYVGVGKPFADHQTVKHSAHEYARGNTHSNSVESFFSRLKRQMYGTHHAVSPRHLHRYVAEVAFKHNTRAMEDGERTVTAIRGVTGKRLVNRTSSPS
ncbi:MAG: IS1595 family transposase [Gemmatimonadales bacterium]|nr:IS1595 family transposase [Gemmatimonadales bacterium]